MENFFGIMKQEMYYGKVYYSLEELKQSIVKYINYYNLKEFNKNLVGSVCDNGNGGGISTVVSFKPEPIDSGIIRNHRGHVLSGVQRYS